MVADQKRQGPRSAFVGGASVLFALRTAHTRARGWRQDPEYISVHEKSDFVTPRNLVRCPPARATSLHRRSLSVSLCHLYLHKVLER